jgi:tight adherence protein B
MRPALGALLGAGAALGVLIACAAWAGAMSRPVVTDRRRMRREPDRLLLRLLLAAFAGAAVWWWTRWPVAGVAAAVAGAAAPSLLGVSGRRRRQLARSEAVAVWAEMLRDLLVTNAGLREAIAKTARFAPPAIAAEVRALDVRAQRGELATALRRFADDVDDSVADTVVVALLLAERRAVADLGGMLAATAQSARDNVAMQLRVDTARARVFRTAQLIAGVLSFFMIVLILLNREYLEPFGTLTGQFALSIILLLFGSAVWGMMLLSRPVVSPRLLRLDGSHR